MIDHHDHASASFVLPMLVSIDHVTWQGDDGLSREVLWGVKQKAEMCLGQLPVYVMDCKDIQVINLPLFA